MNAPILNPMRSLNAMPHPPLSQSGYDFCGGTPFDIQKRTIELLTENPRAYVLSSMGTGKTKCVLWSYDYLRRYGSVQRMLVVAPLSTLQFTWGREIFNTVPHFKYAVLHGSKDKRLALLNDPKYDIFIINHDGVEVILHELVARKDIDVLVIDELAAFRNKNPRTARMQHLASLKPVVWGLTGSPTPNYPTDVYQQARVITPHTVPRFFGRFRDELMVKITNFKWVPKKDANETAVRALVPNVRFTLDDVTELPPFISRQEETALGEKQAHIYKEIKDAAYSMVQEGAITAANAGAVMSKLLQISLGWVYTGAGEIAKLDGDARIATMINTVTSAQNKVIVFVPFKHALGGVVDALTSAGITVERVDGDTPAAERNKTFHRFQSEVEPRVLAAHPQCVAHGITLTAADTIIWYGPITSSEIYEQANARIRRVGQKHKQLFLHLVGTPVEKRIYSLLTKKIVQQDDLLKLLEEQSAF